MRPILQRQLSQATLPVLPVHFCERFRIVTRVNSTGRAPERKCIDEMCANAAG